MAKLFQCNYLENNDDETYLTVGCDNDTEETVDYTVVQKTICVPTIKSVLVKNKGE